MPNTRFYGACRTYAFFLSLDSSITPIQNNEMQAGSSFTFSPVQLQYTPLVIGGTDKNKQLTILKPTQLALTAINILFAL
jgi:hypothetical protein